MTLPYFYYDYLQIPYKFAGDLNRHLNANGVLE